MTAGEYTLKDNRDHLVHPALVRSYCAHLLDRIADGYSKIATSDQAADGDRDVARRKIEVVRGLASEIRSDRWAHLL